jgi:histidine ammonia-lyase
MITLTGSTLNLGQLKAILYQKSVVSLDEKAIYRVRNSRLAVEKIVREDRTVYGINTGFGKFSDVSIDEKDTKALQLHLIRSHACGVGDAFPEIVSRAMVVLRLNALLKGFSGIRAEVLERFAYMLNHQIHPVIPQQGSLGASGDLAPLAHLALVLLGEGFVWQGNENVPAADIWKKHTLEPIVLEAKEGLALINGTQAMTAQGVINYLEAESIAIDSEWIAAMTMEALHGITDAFHPAIHEARGYPEQVGVANRMLDLLEDSQLTTVQGEKRVQDAYSIRCIPQVHGASWQVLNYVKEKLEIEMNAATDNPLIFDDGDTVVSGGNFHGQPIAFAMDFLKIGVAELANISERRIERLVNPQLNEGLPPFLSPEPGLQSGAMILQYSAASLVSENKTLAHPASVDSIPSSGNQEDHVSMGTIGARHAQSIIKNTRNVLAIEALCALTGCTIRGKELMASKSRMQYDKLLAIVDPIDEDRIFTPDIVAIEQFLKRNSAS